MRRTKEDALLTREQLIDSALELFLEHGYAAVTLQQISRKMGMTRGAFYWHFQSKDEILLAICQREAAFIRQLMIKVFQEELQLNVRDRLRTALEKVVENFFENKRYRDFVELTWFKMEHLANDQANQFKSQANEYFIEQCQLLIEKGFRINTSNESLTAGEWAIHFAVLINGIYRLHFITPKLMDKEIALKMVQQPLSLIEFNGFVK